MELITYSVRVIQISIMVILLIMDLYLIQMMVLAHRINSISIIQLIKLKISLHHPWMFPNRENLSKKVRSFKITNYKEILTWIIYLSNKQKNDHISSPTPPTPWVLLIVLPLWCCDSGDDLYSNFKTAASA